MPYYLQPIVSAASIVAACAIVQPHRESKKRSMCGRPIIEALRRMLVSRRDIRYLLMFYSVQQAHLLLCVWVLQSRMALAGVPTWMYSLAYAGWASITSASTKVAQEASYKTSIVARKLIIVVPAVGTFVSGVVTGVLGLVALMVGLLVTTIYSEHMFEAYLFEKLPKDDLTRNTELSIGAAAWQLVFAVFAPFFGMLVDSASLEIALIVLSCTSFVCGEAVTLYGRDSDSESRP